MRGDRGNHYEKLEYRRILGARQFTIPDTAGTSPDLACNNTDTTFSQPTQVSCIPDFAYPLVSSTLFSSASRISFFLLHYSTIIAKHNVISSLSIFPCHDHELIPSAAYTKYSIHQVQHTPSTAYTEYSIHPRLFVFPLFS